MDEPGEKSVKPDNKSGVSQLNLPALYIDRNGPSDPAKLTFVAATGTNRSTFLAANEKLHLDSPEIVSGGDLTGVVNLAANGDMLRLLWIDESGRVAAAQDCVQPGNLNGGAFTFKMPPGTFGHLHKIALVRVPPNGGNIKLEAFEPLRVNEALFWDDYVVLSADDSARKLFPSCAARLELALQRSENPLYLPGWELRANTYAKSRDTKIFERQPPIFDEEAIKKAAASMTKNVAGRGSGLSLWSLGDGNDLSNLSQPFDYDMSAGTLDMFRTWLQSRYGTLKLLNTQWKTNFADWDKVVPPTTDEVKMALNTNYSKRMAILKTGDLEKKLQRRGDEPMFAIDPKELHTPANENVSAWADFRAFNDFAFSRVLREFCKIADDADRKSQTGFVNAQAPSAWGGWEYRNISRSVEWIEEHSSFVAREIMRGLAPRMHCISAAGGQEAASVHRLWDRWLRGDNGCLLPAFADAVIPPFDDIGEMTRGLTLLRNQARGHADPIAIYYSPRSVYLHWMIDSETDGSAWLYRDGRAEAVRGTLNLQLKSWLLLLEDLGYAPYFVHPEDVVAGDLHYPETKVVILPKVLSLSQNEARALREFVNAGGCVIADGECGTFDGMGKRRGPLAGEPKSVGAMDADFGIARKDFIALERDGRFRGDPISSRLVMRGKDNKPVGAESPELRVLEPGISASGGVAHAASADGGKALFSKSSGLGRYFYLNLCMQDYERLRSEKTAPGFKYNGLTNQAYAEKYGAPTGGEALRLAVSDILDEMVGENPLNVKWSTGAQARGLKRVRFDLGSGAAFYAIMPLADAGGDETKPELKGAPLDESALAEVGDGKAHCWYDMRRGEYLGTAEVAKVKIEPNRPAILAALPYAVEKVALKVRRLDKAHIFKINAELIVAGGLPRRHVFHIEVLDLAGKPMPYFAANISAENGACTHEIALGINDPPGTYRVVVRDVLTGKSAEGDLVKDGVEYNGLKFEPKAQ